MDAQAIRKVCLAGGIGSSALYLAMNVAGAVQWREYSSVSQTISELSAIGAPTRPLWVLLGIGYSLLVVAFGWGVAASANNRALHAAGILLGAYGFVGIAWPFAPMHLRGAPFGLTDALHIGLGIVTVVLILAAIAAGAGSGARWFRRYSVVTWAVVFAFGALTALDGPRIAADLPTPWVGVWERISVGAFMAWVAVLALALLHSETA
jgi:hypothetical protein